MHSKLAIQATARERSHETGRRPTPMRHDGQAVGETGGAMVYARIRNWVVATPLAIGSRLQAADVADTLGVSSTPVREALIRLSTEGLVENRRGSGFFIPVPRVEDAFALFETSHLIVQGSLRNFVGGTSLPFPGNDATGSGTTTQAAGVARSCATFNQAAVAATGNAILREMLGTIDDRLFQLRVIDCQTAEIARQQMATIGFAARMLRAAQPDAAIAALNEHHLEMTNRVPHLVERRILNGMAAHAGPDLSSL